MIYFHLSLKVDLVRGCSERTAFVVKQRPLCYLFYIKLGQKQDFFSNSNKIDLNSANTDKRATNTFFSNFLISNSSSNGIQNKSNSSYSKTRGINQLNRINSSVHDLSKKK